MNLSKQALDEFKEIFQRVFGEPISDDEARERAESLMRLMLIALRRQPWDKDDDPSDSKNGDEYSTVAESDI
jgi:hypothetical protein